MKKILFFMTALLSLMPFSLWAQLSVTDAVVFATQAQQPTAVFMTLKNDSDKSVNLAMVESPTGARFELHGTQKGKMITLTGIEIPAHGQTQLKRSGLHIMVFDISKSLINGDHLPLILYFDNGEILHNNCIYPAMSSPPSAKIALPLRWL